MKDLTVLEAIKAAVNIHGELHLDKFKTEILIKYFSHLEDYIEKNDKNIKALQELIKIK